MMKLVHVMSAVVLCCAMAFSASAQGKGQQPDRGGKKETRDIQREPKGDRGGGQDRPRDNGGSRNNGDNGRGGGKRNNRPND